MNMSQSYPRVEFGTDSDRNMLVFWTGIAGMEVNLFIFLTGAGTGIFQVFSWQPIGFHVTSQALCLYQFATLASKSYNSSKSS